MECHKFHKTDTPSIARSRNDRGIKAKPDMQGFRPIIARLGEIPDLCGISLGKGMGNLANTRVQAFGWKASLSFCQMQHVQSSPTRTRSRCAADTSTLTRIHMGMFGPEKLRQKGGVYHSGHETSLCKAASANAVTFRSKKRTRSWQCQATKKIIFQGLPDPKRSETLHSRP